MNGKETEDAQRDRRMDEIARKFAFELDDTCHEIFLTLMAYRKLRFNELHRYLKMFGTEISKPTLSDHLKHLTKFKLIKRKHEDFQNVSYSLTEEIHSMLEVSPEDIKKWLEDFEKNINKLPPHLRIVKFDEKEYYEKLPEPELDHQIDLDLKWSFCLNLHELKNMINYDLKLDKDKSITAFWKFIGNPLYRMHEKSIAMNCRNSERYRKKLFEKIDALLMNSDQTKNFSGKGKKEEKDKR